MGDIEYLDHSIANEGLHADAPIPNTWMDTPPDQPDFQVDMEPPHVNDYSLLKKNPKYAKYFRPHVYRPFPAVMYHQSFAEKIVNTREEAEDALAQGYSRTPFQPRIDMTGKSLPVKSETQRLAEAVAAAAAVQKNGALDAGAIAAIVAAVMAAVKQGGETQQTVKAESEDTIERQALIELAEKENIKIDRRWSDARIKEALGL